MFEAINENDITKYPKYPYEKLDKAFMLFKEHHNYFRGKGFMFRTTEKVIVNKYDYIFNKNYFYRLQLSYKGFSNGGYYTYPEGIVECEKYGFIVNNEHILIDFDEEKYLQQEHLITAHELGML